MSYDERDLKYMALRFNTGFGAASVKEVLGSGIVDSYRDIWDDDCGLLMKVAGDIRFSSGTRTAAKASAAARTEVMRAFEYYREETDRLRLHVISMYDDDYPYAWKNLSGMPKVFFAKGDRSLLGDVFSSGAVSVVGSRHPGSYALYATGQIVKEISEKGIIIISGMAMGIDRQAHMSALDSNGKTIGIMPSGLDIVYPYQNADIFDRICEKGLLISEMPPGQQVLRQYFPARNRLIAALSDACLVMEAGEHSGTLHTASFAANQGKALFVLPNNIYAANAAGSLKLIKDGADILLGSEEVIETVGAQVGIRLYVTGTSVKTDENEASEEEAEEGSEGYKKEDWKKRILNKLDIKDMDIGTLSSELDADFSLLAQCLTELELDKKIEVFEGKYSLTFSGN